VGRPLVGGFQPNLTSVFVLPTLTKNAKFDYNKSKGFGAVRLYDLDVDVGNPRKSFAAQCSSFTKKANEYYACELVMTWHLIFNLDMKLIYIRF